jgi:hypothetical protein
MKILVSETLDKSSREFIDLPLADVIKGIEKDNGWHEVIDMFDADNEVRMYFDIDVMIYSQEELAGKKNITKESVLRRTLDALNAAINCNDADWVICNGHNGNKISYHILSKKYKCSLNNMRRFVRKLELDWVDRTVYFYDTNEPTDQGYFRFPNQSKASINKEGPPLVIEQGKLSDFIVTFVDGLERFNA